MTLLRLSGSLRVQPKMGTCLAQQLRGIHDVKRTQVSTLKHPPHPLTHPSVGNSVAVRAQPVMATASPDWQSSAKQGAPPQTGRYENPGQASAYAPLQQPRVFANYSVYKKKTALTITTIKPKFAYLPQANSLQVSKQGGILLEFAPAVGERKYDWSRKQVFMLSATEGATLMLGVARGPIKFYHDPNMGRSGAGAIGKALMISATPDGSGYFFNLNVKANGPENAGAPQSAIMLTHAEYAVLTNIINYMIPHITGFSAIMDPSLASVETEQGPSPGVNGPY